MSSISCEVAVSRRIVCFGDSVTQGTPYVAPDDTFSALLERRLNMRHGLAYEVCVTNAGVGGENSAEGLVRLDDDVLAHRPYLVTIEFGLNDIRYEPGKRVSEDQFATNLREMHERISATGALVVFMTPTPIVNADHVYSLSTDYYAQWGGCNGLNAIYAEIVREVAAATEAPLCDVYDEFVRRAIEAEFNGETCSYKNLSVLSGLINPADGVHPTAAGHQLIAVALYRTLVSQNLLEPPLPQ